MQDLAQGLAKRKGLTKRDAETFIHKVFEVIEERVVADGVVKIKGFGTFKINTVDSRESVNVATGERFVIDTHSRISFTPHPTLRDAVNRPFSDFETVIISDNVKTEDMEYIPPVDEDSSEPEAPAEEEQPEPADEEPVAEESIAEEPIAEEPVVEEPVAEEPIAYEPVVEEPVVEESVAEEPIAEEPVVEEAVADEPVIEEPVVEEPVVEEPVAEHPSSSNKKSAIIAVVACLVVLCVLCFVFWLPNKSENNKAVNVAEQTAEVQGESSAEKPSATVKKELTPEEAAEKYPQVAGGEYLIVGTKEDYTIQKGDDLYKLSMSVYGDKEFANYIIVYNDLKNPSHIEIDDVLKLPELRKK